MRHLQIFSLIVSFSVVMSYQACGPVGDPVSPSEFSLPSLGDDSNLPPSEPTPPPTEPPSDPTPPPTEPPPTSGDLVFFDNFEYQVNRTTAASDPTGIQNPFVTQGRWARSKAVNITGSSRGYLYTVNQIPGYNGPMPGRNSSRVLAIESRPASMGGQTDFYLQFGDENAPSNTVPANVWFQFWIYSNRYDDPTNQNDQLSTYDGRFKFIYPCRGPYPCQQGQINWLNTLGFTTGEPFWSNQDNTQLFMTTVDPYTTMINYHLAPEWDRYKIGQTNVSENIRPNRWTLIKIHYDTSTTSGAFEAWMKPLGGPWIKVAEWIGGQTPNFSWNIPLSQVGGHRVFRMPTTIDGGDSWMYMDDFAMATSEAALPVYD